MPRQVQQILVVGAAETETEALLLAAPVWSFLKYPPRVIVKL
tara:strand:- start:67 stop:192 length:126 start_codon:yes stop_codon:yes gene_type:complete